ncbi:MAG: dipeptidase [Anaerolineaceae bacterium]|nr:dipeptidase [Anaerolineaceae bacterium]
MTDGDLLQDRRQYVADSENRFVEELCELLRIPSISTRAEHAADVARAARWIAEKMRRAGLEAVEVITKEGQCPLVYGEWLGAGPQAPTALIYCHYDVQPAFLADGWRSDPFQPVIRDGKLYARGAVDSKSHVMIQLHAVEAALAKEALPINVKYLFEGEEESSGAHILSFVREQPQKIHADYAVASDGSMPDRGQPALVYALRGIVSCELRVQGPARDLHSGHYGGNVHNPAQALCEILAQLHDENGTVTVPGFYDQVIELGETERAELAQALPWIEREWHEVTEAPQAWGESDYNLHERTGARPTLEINGIAGGYAEEGFKTVLPAQAIAKISCRLVARQDPVRILCLLADHIARLTPPTVTSELRSAGYGEPAVVLELGTAVMEAALTAYERAWGKKPLLLREGGSIPIVASFERELGLPMALMPFGYKGCGAHGPNEHVYLDMVQKGIHTMLHFYDELARQHAAAV